MATGGEHAAAEETPERKIVEGEPGAASELPAPSGWTKKNEVRKEKRTIGVPLSTIPALAGGEDVKKSSRDAQIHSTNPKRNKMVQIFLENNE